MVELSSYMGDTQFMELKRKVIEVGGDNPEVFGSHNYGGYLLQQNPDEFAGLVKFLKGQGPFNVYVEIGSASGGNLRFVYENVGFKSALSMDDNMHPDAVHQHSNSWHFGERLTRYVGDSHRPEAARMLNKWLDGRMIDCAFIDGDHRLDGIMQDYEMLRPYLTPRSLVILHDTVSIPDIGEAVRRLSSRGLITPVAHFAAHYKTCGIMVVRPVVQ